MAARTQSALFYAGTGSGTSYTIPGSGSIATIAAGSLVRFAFRYEGGAAVTLSATDSAGASYSVVQNTSLDSPSVAVFYKHNHPGGTNVTITVTLASSRSYIEAVGEVMSGTVGELDPLTGTYGTDTYTAGPMVCTVTGVGGDADLFMALGSYSGSTYGGDAGSTLLHTDVYTLYSNAAKQHFTGSGDKTISSTGGSGQTRAIAVAFLDDAGTGGGGSSTIAADQGTFTHTGQAANLLFGRKLTADFGSFVLSGQDVTLTKTTAYSITADYGSFSLAGQDVAFQKTDAGSYVLTAEVGLFSLVGQGALASYSMNAEIGSFVIAGQEVTFSIGVPAAYSLTADAGSYSLTGQNARLDWSGAPIVPNRQAGIYMGMRIGL